MDGVTQINAPKGELQTEQGTGCAWLGVGGSGVGAQSISTTNPVTPGWQGIAVQQGGLGETSTTLFGLAQKIQQEKKNQVPTAEWTLLVRD